MRIGVIGATGPAGRAVSVQMAGIGLETVVGSRDAGRAADTVSEITAAWPGRDLPLRGGTNEEAAAADLIVMATPWDSILTTVGPLTGALEGKIVVSMANALTRWGTGMVPLLPPTGSVTVGVALAVPAARVIGAFHHLPAKPWQDLDHPLDADVLVCGDDRAAVREFCELVDRLPGLRGVDSGGLSSALAIEALTPVLLEVNRRHKAHVAVRLSGLTDR